MRRLNFAAIAAATSVFLGAGVAAAAELVIEGGQLVGATGVDVNGTLYDVSFINSSCAETFSGCDENSDFAFTSEQDSIDASLALLDQVFLDSDQGEFDSVPNLTGGCDAPALRCRVHVPYEALGENVRTTYAFNRDGDRENIIIAGFTNLTIAESMRARGGSVYALFTPTTPVPVPGAAVLMISGVAGLVAARRKRKA